MNYRRYGMLLGVLLCLVATPRAHGQGALQLRRPGMADVALNRVETTAPSIVDSMSEWWGRHKRALQYLTACGLASASLSYAMIVGLGNPVGGAVLGLIGASVMVLVCL